MNFEKFIYCGFAVVALCIYKEQTTPPPKRPLAPVRVNTPPIHVASNNNDSSWDLTYNLPRPAGYYLAKQLAAEKNVPESALGNIFEELNDVVTQRQQIAKERNVPEKDLDLLYIELGKKK